MNTTNTPEFLSPVVAPKAQAASAALQLSDETAMTKVVVKAKPGTPARGSLAQPFAGSRMGAGVLIAGTRPDEWMLIGSHDDVSARVADLSTEGHVSVVDWTHGRAQFRLTGNVATSALEKVCGLDWSDAMMPNGAVTSGSVAKVSCDLIRNDVDGTPSYLVLCDRSFGQYLYDALLDAMAEFA